VGGNCRIGEAGCVITRGDGLVERAEVAMLLLRPALCFAVWVGSDVVV
jgi:hypothetical protein